MRRAAAIAVAVALVLCAGAVALAATPGTYRGKTKQGRRVKVRVNDSGRVIFVSIGWRAKCDSGKRPTVKTSFADTEKNPIEQDAAGFGDSGSTTSNLSGGYKARVHVKLAGTWDPADATKASGTFKGRIKVRKNGKLVDTCKRATKWSVTRQ